MKNKIAILLFIFMALVSSNIFCFASETRYIENTTDLINFAGEVNGGKSFKDVTVELTTDINLMCDENNQWTPIGSRSKPFDGTFDGAGHIISGIYIKKDDYSDAALFGYNNGIIMNVGVIGNITSKGHLAGICADNVGTIFQCYNDATITGESIGIGGIVAWNRRY